MIKPPSANIVLRKAVLADIPILEKWDQEPHVISATTDKKEINNHDWSYELGCQDQYYQYYIAELDGRPIGGMNICDPHFEASHYWGEIAKNLRALDIWIGEASDLGQGHGEQMMRAAFEICFSDSKVTAILIDPLFSNQRAHKFYQRLGFKPVRRQMFGEDDTLVHVLTREDWQTSSRV